MSAKKKLFIIGSVLVCLVSYLPTKSLSNLNNINNNTKCTGLYVSGQYKPTVSHFSNFSLKETYTDTKELLGLAKDIKSITDITTNKKFNIPYNTKFQDNAVSFSAAVGYISQDSPRVEVEWSYEEFDVKNPGNYVVSEAFRYIALARGIDNLQKYPETNKYVVIKNNGLSVASIIINGCYDFSLNNLKVSPYICVGFGGDIIEFFSAVSFKFAYQGKVGISYPLFSNMIIFADGYYHKVIGNKFNNLNVQHVVSLNSHPKSTFAVATLNVEYFGSEFGLKFIF
ncbi:major outer membrane protein OMP-1W [Ehrlichia chaffeensis str. Arkansas]|uniref:Major outer membrane protein OMP-1W n=2 Tax=Ehrlichia chaffeensis TaxID=945 RepID=Q2GF70_EHRCR|nr:P44/Msp2 family outer membrane protein [Ehrlichia chaffeensis]AAF73416.1 P28-7 [Ehrlichia chaffeensis]AAK28667.1 major outer membrane protein OMP-1W [Ehrlichia chaffeensis]ABD45032.1 major outer membrane protein OMP-1W [Ehrlichia chaffeensis str. Arkansas]AHX07872.1 surface antigen family protein [Ehrlichia chaffeensis str. Osceola]